MHSRWKVLIAAFILLAAGWFLFGSRAEETPVPPPASSAEAVASQSYIGALGRIEPRSRVVRISHDAGPEGARVSELHIAEGQTVRKGEPIALFSDHPRKLAQRDAALARIAMLEARIAAESTKVDFTARDFERYRELAKDNAVSQSQRDAKELEYRQSRAQLNALRAELASARADVTLAEEQLKQSILLAPIDGTILKIHTWPGERVGESGVAEMADLTALDVVAEIYERDMPQLREGQAARIFVPGMEESFSGEVRELGYLVRKNDVNDTDPLADRDNRVVEVRITLAPEAVGRLRHLLYMQVDVRLE